MSTRNQNNNPSLVQSWAQWFDRCARHYPDLRMKMAYYQDGQTGEPLPPETMDAIYADIWQKLSVTKDTLVLDVGAGVGMLSQKYCHLTKRVVNTDISLTMIQESRHLNPQGTFVICAAYPLPFQSASFDRLVCYSVFHYLKNLEAVASTIDEFRRVLKKNGLVLIGDILKPPLFSQRQNHLQASRPSKIWWPSSLNHNLTKLTIEPDFFVQYAQRKGCRCEILSQQIPLKPTASWRYDVIIRP